MASRDEEFETDNGIEAGDLASLLCRFEEATSSVSDLRLCVQNENSRDTIIKARNSMSTPDSSAFTVQPMSCSLANERNTAKAHHSSASVLSRNGTYSNFSFIEPPLCQTEPTDKATTVSFLSTETQLVHIQTEQSETTVVEIWNSLSAKIFEDSGSPAVLGPQETNSSKNMLLMEELGLQDAVSKCSTLISVNLKNSKPSVSLAPSIESSFEALTSEILTECPVLTTVGAFEVNSIPISSHELMQLQSNKNPVLSSISSISGDNFGRLVPKNVDLINAVFSHDKEHGSDIENCILKRSLSQHAIINFESSDISNDFDHSYCSNNLLLASDMHKSEFFEEPLRSSNFTTSKIILHPKQATALDIGEPSYSITDVLCDYSVVTNSKNTDELILEDKEIFVDSNGNDLYSQDACQSFNTRRCEYNQEAMAKTPEKKENRKRLYSCLQHQKYNTGSVENVFYDKIPSYYTALSIPLKPVTTTVFASTTKAIGTTDHLDLLDASGPFDEGHYDKVPAHRRCFTNTTRDVDIKCENSDVHDTASNIIPVQNYFKNSSHEINSSSLPFQSVLSCVENDEKHASMLHSHYSKIQERRSRSTTRCSSSTSRFSRRSASSMSDCSTCSSCSNSSGCSTCSIFSRSPSSSGSERGSSRSRSLSSNGDSKYPAKRKGHHLTPSKVSRSRSRTVSPSEDSGWRSKQHSHRNRHNSSMEARSEKRKIKEEEQAKAMEERRIVYVGKIPDGYTKKQLYQRFQSFGEIREVKVNFREHGDNYGFVTFAYACDAIAAKEKGNIIPGEVKFDLCFGGRRHFCPDQYSDLDGNREIEEEYAPMSRNVTEDLDYTALLKLHSTHQRKKIA